MPIYDIEEWIQVRAEELADIEYDRPFEQLTENTQLRLWEQAQAEYTDYEAARRDALYDRECERTYLLEG